MGFVHKNMFSTDFITDDNGEKIKFKTLGLIVDCDDGYFNALDNVYYRASVEYDSFDAIVNVKVDTVNIEGIFNYYASGTVVKFVK